MYMRGHPSLWLGFAPLAFCFACRGDLGVSIREVERDPSRYTGRVITIRGCYHNGAESALLQPCSDPILEEIVWVISRNQLENSEKAIPGYSAGSVPIEAASASERRLAEGLSRLPDGVLAEVELRGEFRTSGRPDFGAGPGYRHEFVVHRVLKVVPR